MRKPTLRDALQGGLLGLVLALCLGFVGWVHATGRAQNVERREFEDLRKHLDDLRKHLETCPCGRSGEVR